MTEMDVKRSQGTLGSQLPEQQIVEFLQDCIDQDLQVIGPARDLDAPIAYGYPAVEEFFDCSADEARELLEALARKNILDRSIEDRVHRCPDCGWYTLNFQEVCPSCQSIDIEIQEVIHHFSCAYVGSFAEFRNGHELECPKCHDVLRNIGMDYEKPSDTYICHECENVFTESRVQARCLRDETVIPAEELSLTSIYQYRTTERARKAVDLDRLDGLDVRSMLFEEDTLTTRTEFFLFELNREMKRACRYENELSLVLFWFDGLELISSGSNGSAERKTHKQLLDSVVESLRTLDLVSSLDRGLGVMLLPETSEEGAKIATDRVQSKLQEHPLIRQSDKVSITGVVGTYHGAQEDRDAKSFVELLHEALMQAVEDVPGEVISVDLDER